MKTYRPDFVIIDTINAFIDQSDGDRVDIALGNIARKVKDIAEELGSLAILVAQLKDMSGRPLDKDSIKESRQIRDACDFMDFVYREYEKNPVSQHTILSNVFEVYRVKGRLTGIGSCYLKFEKENGRISDLEESSYEEIKDYIKRNNRKLFA
jgi:hypothetical protein